LDYPVILAIESSCDDTSASVIAGGKVLSNITATQTIHEKYGGVVPEVASRAHQEKMLPVVMEALSAANIALEKVQAIAFTRGPGLIGSLMVGVSFAKGLAFSRRLPMIEVNHMKAHILAHFIDEPRPSFPFLCLTVSGGHTQIVMVRDYDDMEVLGETIDDAAGEAFDKTGKLLGLDYPAGPHLDKLARQGKAVFQFPIPEVKDLNFSFSGLKTAILYFIQDKLKDNPNFIEENLANICASVQETIVTILLRKLRKASRLHGIKEIAIAGGVSANSGLRSGIEEMAKKEGWNVYIPAFQYCTDNAGMIAMAAHFEYLQGNFILQDVAPTARMPI
jgi:N6-L-threonylcarbamoyladenine synthase